MSNVANLSLDRQDYSDLIIGIDLGTTNSAVAIHNAGKVPTLCPMASGGKTTMPSCVRWEGGDTFTVGSAAFNTRYLDDTCYSVKRLMGSDEVVVFKRDNGEELRMTPAQVSSKILGKLKSIVNELYPGVRRCVITVPAYFNQRQIEDTITAAKLADLECIQILKEPTSASYVYSNLGYANGTTMIYDLGGGTFDVTVMSFLKKDAVTPKMRTALKKMYKIDVDDMHDADSSSLFYSRVLGTYGDTRLGGDDIDREMASIAAHENGVVFPEGSDDSEFEELILRCEEFKRGDAHAMDIYVRGRKYHIDRQQLEKATERIFLRTLSILNTIEPAHLDDVKTIVLVGGSTKSDYLVSRLKEVFPGREISRILDPDSTVALGAGAVARDLQEGRALSYQDVLPLAIGVLVNESEVSVCIPRNTAMPHSSTLRYYTLHDNQQAVSVDVYQGVSSDPQDCTYLGKLRITDIPPAEAGKIPVDISFILDAQGRLKVVTTVAGVDKEATLVIDSIFNVVSETPTVSPSDYDFDDFERSIASDCEKHPELASLVVSRRQAIMDGDDDKAAEIEFQILEVL